MTAQDLIDSALRTIGVLDAGESPSTTERNDGLTALNHIVQSWNAQALPIPQITRQTVALTGAQSYALATRPIKIKAAAVLSTASVDLPLVIADAAGWAAFMDKQGTSDFGELLYYEDGYPLGKIHVAPKASGTLALLMEKAIGSGVMQVRETLALTGAASYTIGSGGLFNVDRPVRVLGGSIAAGSSVTKGLRLVTAEEWAAYPAKGAGGNFAEVLFYDGAYPTGTVWLAPKPATGGTLELFNYIALASFATLATVIDLPPGYERALRLCLAVELAPEFGRALDPTVEANAENAKASIFGLNAAILGTPNPPAPAPPQAPAKAPPIRDAGAQ